MTTEQQPITEEVYKHYLDHVKNAHHYEEAFKARATEVALLMSRAQDVRIEHFGEKHVTYECGFRHDDFSSFPVDLLWVPDYKERVAAYHEEMRQRCDRIAAASEAREKKETEQRELKELARLKAKYPNA